MKFNSMHRFSLGLILLSNGLCFHDLFAQDQEKPQYWRCDADCYSVDKDGDQMSYLDSTPPDYYHTQDIAWKYAKAACANGVLLKRTFKSAAVVHDYEKVILNEREKEWTYGYEYDISRKRIYHLKNSHVEGTFDLKEATPENSCERKDPAHAPAEEIDDNEIGG